MKMKKVVSEIRTCEADYFMILTKLLVADEDFAPGSDSEVAEEFDSNASASEDDDEDEDAMSDEE